MPPRSQNKIKPRTHICLHKSCSKAFATRGGMRQHMSASHPDPRGFLPLQDSPAANPPLDNDFTEQDDGAHNDYSGPAMPRFNYHPVLDGMYCIITIYAQNNQGYDKGTPCDVDGIDLPAVVPRHLVQLPQTTTTHLFLIAPISNSPTFSSPSSRCLEKVLVV